LSHDLNESRIGYQLVDVHTSLESYSKLYSHNNAAQLLNTAAAIKVRGKHCLFD